jgi:hypothetical protein
MGTPKRVQILDFPFCIKHFCPISGCSYQELRIRDPITEGGETMKLSVIAVSLALMVGGCAAQHPTTPPPLKLAVEAPAPKPEAPPPPTDAEILQAQPSQVRDVIKEHEQSDKWPIY